MTEETKAKILKVFEEAYPQDLSIAEVSRRAQLSDVTAATYLRILEAGNRVEFTRKVGRAKMFRLKWQTGARARDTRTEVHVRVVGGRIRSILM